VCLLKDSGENGKKVLQRIVDHSGKKENREIPGKGSAIPLNLRLEQSVSLSKAYARDSNTV